MFEDMVKGLNEGGGSVRAYEACAKEARQRIANEPDNAAALILIASATQRFVDAYDELPLTVEAASREFEAISSIVETLGAAWASGSAERKLAALNSVAARLAPQKAASDRTDRVGLR
ncbi:MAG: hypothetical protein ED558_02950 [Oricola sp.]|jgi:hypothetical protein|nr:MAG: hypothetical protein ED558_02950 [Oricola sp.]